MFEGSPARIRISQPALRTVLYGRQIRGWPAALALVDVRVLNHLVVAGDEVCSFAERCLL